MQTCQMSLDHMSLTACALYALVVSASVYEAYTGSAVEVYDADCQASANRQASAVCQLVYH